MKFKYVQADSYIAFAVFLQSLLVVLQQLMIAIFHEPEENTTIYRILLTAIPLSIAICISFYRRCLLFISVYVVTAIILLGNILIFPQNETFLWHDSLRFLLPIVIPSALCLMCVSNIIIVEKVLYKISWVIVLLVAFYVISFLRGIFVITDYNMSLSYGLLLPLMSLYSRKKWYSICAALFLFIVIIVFGSRGAAIFFVLYLCYDIFQNKRYIFPVLVFTSVCILCLPIFLKWLEEYGIHSRTLALLLSNDISNSSGRDELYDKMISIFWDNPLLGIGLWGDRFILHIYCHNILLELYLNWGMVIGSILLLGFIYKFLHVYIQSNKINRNILIKYFLALLMPLMVSGSYLISYDFGAFIGILVLIDKDNHIC